MRVVLVRLSALGDIIHTWPLALALRNHQPDVHLTWVVEAPFRPLVEGHPAVDTVMPVATKKWRKAPFSAETRSETGVVRTRLRELQPDLALDSQGTLKSAWITRWTSAPDRVGLARPWRRELIAALAYTQVLQGSRRDPHIVATNSMLVSAIGGHPTEKTPMPDGQWLLKRSTEKHPGFRRNGPYAVLLPGAGHPSKILGADILGDIAQRLASRKMEIIVAWGPGEINRAEAVVACANGAAALAPPTDIEQLTILLGNASVVVGGDTGPVHLAASLGVPTLGIYLTTDWRRNGPLGLRTAVLSGATLPSEVRPGSAGAKAGTIPSVEAIEAKVDILLDTA